MASTQIAERSPDCGFDRCLFCKLENCFLLCFTSSSIRSLLMALLYESLFRVISSFSPFLPIARLAFFHSQNTKKVFLGFSSIAKMMFQAVWLLLMKRNFETQTGEIARRPIAQCGSASISETHLKGNVADGRSM